VAYRLENTELLGSYGSFCQSRDDSLHKASTRIFVPQILAEKPFMHKCLQTLEKTTLLAFFELFSGAV
jgi:hypothetical protein